MMDGTVARMRGARAEILLTETLDTIRGFILVAETAKFRFLDDGSIEVPGCPDLAELRGMCARIEPFLDSEGVP